MRSQESGVKILVYLMRLGNAIDKEIIMPSYSGAGYGESRKSGFEAGGGKATSCSTVTGVGCGVWGVFSVN